LNINPDMRSLLARNMKTISEIGGSPAFGGSPALEDPAITFRPYIMRNLEQSTTPYLYAKEWDLGIHPLLKENTAINCLIDLSSPALNKEDAYRALNFLSDHARARTETVYPRRITIIAPAEMSIPADQ
jgi:hypothetical protein